MTHDATKRHIYSPAQLRELLDEKHDCYKLRWDQLHTILSCYPTNPFDTLNTRLAKLEERLAAMETRP